MSKMRDADMPLVERIDAAIERITHGQAAMRVPVEATDPDVVLADCQMEIERLRAENEKLRGEYETKAAELASLQIAFNDWKVMHSTVRLKVENERLYRQLAEAEMDAQQEIDNFKHDIGEYIKITSAQAQEILTLTAERDELRRQLAEVGQDARRYRDWLRGGANIPPESTRWARWEVRYWNGRHWDTLFAEQMDAAIDAAMGLTRPAEES